MNEVVAIMTGAAEPGYEQAIKEARHDAEAGHAAEALKSGKED
jgi:hypothetical protein